MKIRDNVFIIMAVVLLVSSACKKNPYKINISSEKVDIEIKRLEKDLFSLNPEEIESSLPEIKKKYDGFLQLFSYVINAGETGSPDFYNQLVSFCTDKQNNDVYDLTIKMYPDLTKVKRDLEKAFRHYKHYFPQRTIPGIFTCITGFNNSIITGDSVLGIGLDRYLGADCEYYPRLEIYSYISRRMTPDFIIPDCMNGWAASEWDFSTLHYENDNVLANIIHEGKLRYFMKCMLPELSDEIIFGFTEGQMKFCRNNESQMWQYLIENDLMFKTDRFIIRKLVGEAPFTSYFTNESPGRAAVWIGFRIVESYMARNHDANLESLMKDINMQEILEKAKYNPQ